MGLGPPKANIQLPFRSSRSLGMVFFATANNKVMAYSATSAALICELQIMMSLCSGTAVKSMESTPAANVCNIFNLESDCKSSFGIRFEAMTSTSLPFSKIESILVSE